MKPRKNKFSPKLYIPSIGFLLIGQGAVCAEGQLGAQSESTFNVSVQINEVPKQISISGLTDIMIEKTLGDGPDATQEVKACVYLTGGGTYSVKVEADPLVSGLKHYPYKIQLSQPMAGSPSLLLDVGATASDSEVFGFVGSNVDGCALQSKLTVSVIDVGSDLITEAFSAQAVVRLTVKPE